ncbi:MAG: hypothetical protein RL417_1427 [Pseudomonadota bacterium]
MPTGRSPLRRLELILGNRAAGAALSAYRGTEPVVRGLGRGAPRWPEGFCGSISHTSVAGAVYAVAAVANDPSIRSLGVDIEGVRPVAPQLIHRIGSPGEIAWVEEQDTLSRTIAVFSAREALFKAIHPLYQQRLRYHETILVWDPTRGGFAASTILPARGGARVETFVRVVECGGLVLTGVVVSAGTFPE